MEISEEFIICIRRDDELELEDERPGKKSIIVISLKDIRDKLLRTRVTSKSKSKGSFTITEDLRSWVSIEHAIPFTFPIGRRPEIVLCDYHWRPKGKSGDDSEMVITVCEDARGVSEHKGVYTARFSLKFKVGGDDPPSLQLRHVEEKMWMFAAPGDRVKQHGGVFAILPNWSNPGCTPIVFHGKGEKAREDEVQLALMSVRHEMGMRRCVFRDKDESAALTTFRSEFYTGSVVYASKDYGSVIVCIYGS